MAKQPTQKSKYKSRYSDGYITAAQYILEIVCEKKAAYDKKDLPTYFWKLPEWAAYYKRCLRQTHKLLKTYDERAIIRALKSKESEMKYSIFTESMIRLIGKYQKVVERENLDDTLGDTVEASIINSDTLDSVPREPMENHNIIFKLREMDGI